MNYYCYNKKENVERCYDTNERRGGMHELCKAELCKALHTPPRGPALEAEPLQMKGFARIVQQKTEKETMLERGRDGTRGSERG